MQGLTIDELMRSFGRESFVALAEGAGLRVQGSRMQCPFVGCRDHRTDRPANVSLRVGKDGCWHLHCWRCGESGRYIDLIMAVRGVTLEQALEELRGAAAVAPAPRLRVVPPPVPPDEGKLKPGDVERLWRACNEADEAGQAYLDKRGLGEATGAGLVRFVGEAHPDSALRRGAAGGRRIAMLMRDVVGNARGMQVRLCREPLASDKAKVLTVKGSVMAGAFFGAPEKVEASGCVLVTEGMADTLAVALWAGDAADTCVVGAPGKNNLARLAEELERCGVPVEGRIFALFPQNDRPTNASRREFDRLAKLLTAAKATVVWLNVPDEHKDVAAWLAASEPQEWPPLPLARAMGLAQEDATPSAAALVSCLDGAVPVPSLYTVEDNRQDFSTLLALLDDPAMRFGIVHKRGTWEWNEMTQRPALGRMDVGASDWVAIRAGLEAAGRSTSAAKPLRWPVEDIQSAVLLLARRQPFHPVRDWLNGLRWDGVPRLESELPRALGVEEYGFEAKLLRLWCVGAVARAMKPGSKMDTMLVLVGGQGTMKSTFFSVMGGQWFTDQSIDVHDKDGRMVIHSAWIVEWAELDAMRRSRDAEATKAFLTQRVDKYRPPYARDLIDAPRSCVIVGTTNHADFLSDSTGNRRFWPVNVTQRINVARVGELREQLWAEAMASYVAGEAWHLEADLEAVAAEHTARHLEHDPWEEPVSAWLRQQGIADYVRTADALTEALGKPTGQWSRGDEMRAGRVLQALGWRRTKRFVDGRSVPVYLRPGIDT